MKKKSQFAFRLAICNTKSKPNDNNNNNQSIEVTVLHCQNDRFDDDTTHRYCVGIEM